MKNIINLTGNHLPDDLSFKEKISVLAVSPTPNSLFLSATDSLEESKTGLVSHYHFHELDQSLGITKCVHVQHISAPHMAQRRETLQNKTQLQKWEFYNLYTVELAGGRKIFVYIPSSLITFHLLDLSTSKQIKTHSQYKRTHKVEFKISFKITFLLTIKISRHTNINSTPFSFFSFSFSFCFRVKKKNLSRNTI